MLTNLSHIFSLFFFFIKEKNPHYSFLQLWRVRACVTCAMCVCVHTVCTGSARGLEMQVIGCISPAISQWNMYFFPMEQVNMYVTLHMILLPTQQLNNNSESTCKQCRKKIYINILKIKFYEKKSFSLVLGNIKWLMETTL